MAEAATLSCGLQQEGDSPLQAIPESQLPGARGRPQLRAGVCNGHSRAVWGNSHGLFHGAISQEQG